MAKTFPNLIRYHLPAPREVQQILSRTKTSKWTNKPYIDIFLSISNSQGLREILKAARGKNTLASNEQP